MYEPQSIEQCVIELIESFALLDEGDEIDDLDVDDAFEVVIEMSTRGPIEWLDTPTRHADSSWGDVDDPYWELGDGD